MKVGLWYNAHKKMMNEPHHDHEMMQMETDGHDMDMMNHGGHMMHMGDMSNCNQHHHGWLMTF